MSEHDVDRYFIKFGNFYEREVSKEEFMQMERFCGFYPKVRGKTATADFGMLKDGVEIKGWKSAIPRII